ncbi:hypothetical protein AB205_0213250, partial [Aquarana catesbeiana]
GTKDSEDTTQQRTPGTPPPDKERELQKTPHPEELEEGEVEEVGEFVTTTGDLLVVEEQAQHFTSASAQLLIQDIMTWNREIDIIRNKLNFLEQQIKNMIDVLGRI